MTNEPATTRYAVRLPEQERDRPALEAYLRSEGIESAARFLPKDDDDLNRDVNAGEFDAVVYPHMDALLTAVWKGDAALDAWAKRGIRLIIADESDQDQVGRWAQLTKVYSSLQAWRARQRRRQTIAAVVLSLLALVAIAVLFTLIPPAN